MANKIRWSVNRKLVSDPVWARKLPIQTSKIIILLLFITSEKVQFPSSLVHLLVSFLTAVVFREIRSEINSLSERFSSRNFSSMRLAARSMRCDEKTRTWTVRERESWYRARKVRDFTSILSRISSLISKPKARNEIRRKIRPSKEREKKYKNARLIIKSAYSNKFFPRDWKETYNYKFNSSYCEW